MYQLFVFNMFLSCMAISFHCMLEPRNERYNMIDINMYFASCAGLEASDKFLLPGAIFSFICTSPYNNVSFFIIQSEFIILNLHFMFVYRETE